MVCTEKANSTFFIILETFFLFTEVHTLEKEFYVSAGGWVVLVFAFICCILITVLITKAVLIQRQSQLTHIKNTPVFGFPNQYSSLPTKDVSIAFAHVFVQINEIV